VSEIWSFSLFLGTIPLDLENLSDMKVKINILTQPDSQTFSNITYAAWKNHLNYTQYRNKGACSL